MIHSTTPTGDCDGIAATNSPAAAAFQREVDATPASAFQPFRFAGADMDEALRLAAYGAAPALRRYDEAFDSVVADVHAAEVPEGSPPAVWFLYNMGVVVKTPRAVFGIDVAHRKGALLAPLLDFALVTHNHDDHVDAAFLEAMDGEGKTVVSNFFDNYGAFRGGRMPGGYTRGGKAFELGDAAVLATSSDHNGYLVDFTLAFEIRIGDWTLYHTGDSANLGKLRPARTPDLWFVHPRCGIDPVAAALVFQPRRTILGHFCELGHAEWRWTIADAGEDAERLRDAGFRATIPLWGKRLQQVPT